MAVTFPSPTIAGDYQALCNAVADELNRADLTASIPNFVALANTRISRDLSILRHQASLKKTALILTASWTALPLDFISMYLVSMPSATLHIEYLSPEDIVRLGEAGEPTGGATYYSVVNDGIVVYPTPDVSSPVTIGVYYYAALPDLNATTTTNWASLRYPDLFFYGALVHSAPYLKADERVATWEGAYKTIYNDIVVEASRGNTPQASLRAISKGF